jgi:hypothetical protein
MAAEGPLWYPPGMRALTVSLLFAASVSSAPRNGADPTTALTTARGSPDSTHVTATTSDTSTGLPAAVVLEKLDSLYSSAWNRLVAFTVVLVGVVGVVAPALVAWGQMRTFQSEVAAIKAELQERLAADLAAVRRDIHEGEEARAALIKAEIASEKARTEALVASLRDHNDQVLAKSQKKMGRAVLRAQSRLLHVQGGLMFERKAYGLATQNYAFAARLQARTRDEVNLARVLNVMTGEVAPRLDKTHFANSTLKLDEALESMFKAVGKLNKNGAYEERVVALRKQIELAKAREHNVG